MVFDRCFASVVLAFSLQLMRRVCCPSLHVVELGRSCPRLSPSSLSYVSSDFVYLICFFLMECMWFEQGHRCQRRICGNSARSRTPMSRLRNRQHAEEEDASALKLGAGVDFLGSPAVFGLTVDDRVQQCWLLADIRGQVSIGEPGQGSTRHRVSSPPIDHS